MEERNADGLYKCCANTLNLVVVKKSDDMVTKVCRICHRNHYELSVEPIPIGIEMAPIGS